MRHDDEADVAEQKPNYRRVPLTEAEKAVEEELFKQRRARDLRLAPLRNESTRRYLLRTEQSRREGKIPDRYDEGELLNPDVDLGPEVSLFYLGEYAVDEHENLDIWYEGTWLSGEVGYDEALIPVNGNGLCFVVDGSILFPLQEGIRARRRGIE